MVTIRIRIKIRIVANNNNTEKLWFVIVIHSYIYYLQELWWVKKGRLLSWIRKSGHREYTSFLAPIIRPGLFLLHYHKIGIGAGFVGGGESKRVYSTGAHRAGQKKNVYSRSADFRFFASTIIKNRGADHRNSDRPILPSIGRQGSRWRVKSEIGIPMARAPIFAW